MSLTHQICISFAIRYRGMLRMAFLFHAAPLEIASELIVDLLVPALLFSEYLLTERTLQVYDLKHQLSSLSGLAQESLVVSLMLQHT